MRFRLQNIAGTGQNERRAFVGNDHHRFQAAQIPVRTPILGQFHAGPHQLPGILLKLAFQPGKQSERVRRGASEAADDLAVLADLAHLARVSLDDRCTQADLPITSDDDTAAFANSQNGGGMPALLRGRFIGW